MKPSRQRDRLHLSPRENDSWFGVYVGSENRGGGAEIHELRVIIIDFEDL